MKLSSARDAKLALLASAEPVLARVAEDAIELLPSPARRGGRRGSRGAADATPLRSIESIRAEVSQAPLFAVGVAPVAVSGRKRPDYHLAVRIYAKTQEAGKAALADLWRRDPALKRETNVIFGVRLRARGTTLIAGTSCAHFNVGAGTLGAFVTDGQQRFILSCNHVLAGSNPKVDHPIVQPSPNDSPNVRIVGRLFDWISLGRAKVDAAIALISDSASDGKACFYPTIGTTASTIVANLKEVTEVIKEGKTTNVTTGRVTAHDADQVTMNYIGGKSVTFDNQIEIVSNDGNQFSKGGDSGAVILDKKTLRPYALLCGGGKGKDASGRAVDLTYAQFLPEVFSELGVRLAT